MELALFWFEVEVIVAQNLEDLSDNHNVLCCSCRKDEDVVHIYCDFPGEDGILEDIIHHGLEGCWGVGESKKHYRGLKEP